MGGSCKESVKGTHVLVRRILSCSMGPAPLYMEVVHQPQGSSLTREEWGFCDCDYGYSYSQEDDTCYKEHTPGPCGEKETWLRRRTPKKHRTGHKVFGKCKMNKCAEGMLEWKDKKCYKVDQGEMFAMCVAEEKGEIELEDEVLTCKLVMEGRAVVGGISRSCRRGRAWSRYRNRCVRVYSR